MGQKGPAVNPGIFALIRLRTGAMWTSASLRWSRESRLLAMPEIAAPGTNATFGPRRPMSAVGSRTDSTRSSPLDRSWTHLGVCGVHRNKNAHLMSLQTWGPRRNRDLTAYAETAYMPIRLIPAAYRRLCDVQVEEGGNRSAHAGDVSAR